MEPYQLDTCIKEGVVPEKNPSLPLGRLLGVCVSVCVLVTHSLSSFILNVFIISSSPVINFKTLLRNMEAN